ncbi:MAG TPA: ferrochelatase [Frankiaceae bacterium]|nr:ferrochelatase [Frankiaceae bacterium]
MTIGVLAMAYGTPTSRERINMYYTDIRRGKAPTAAQLADLTARYDAIGGTFPLRAITDKQCATLQTALGKNYRVALGTKHSTPSIEDGVAALSDCDRIVGLVLAPHYSNLSVGDYARRAARAGDGRGIPVSTIESWHLLPEYLRFLADAVLAAQAKLPDEVQRDAEVVFTAHSLPEKAVPADDPYPDQVRATGEAVATLTDLFRWSVAWQSAGKTPDPWLGPDILEVIRTRAAEGAAGIVVCPCGFVADHLEVMYDLDIEARKVAEKVGLPFARTASLNNDRVVFRALAKLVKSHTP